MNIQSIRIVTDLEVKFYDYPYAQFFRFEGEFYLKVQELNIDWSCDKCEICHENVYGNSINLANGNAYHFCPNDMIFPAYEFHMK